jgi:hypothetical protein
MGQTVTDRLSDASRAIMDMLAASPIDRWQCSDGCKWIRAVTLGEEKEHGYRCAFFDRVNGRLPYRGGIIMEAPDMTYKRIHGPHTDVTHSCNLFEATP